MAKALLAMNRALVTPPNGRGLISFDPATGQGAECCCGGSTGDGCCLVWSWLPCGTDTGTFCDSVASEVHRTYRYSGWLSFENNVQLSNYRTDFQRRETIAYWTHRADNGDCRTFAQCLDDYYHAHERITATDGTVTDNDTLRDGCDSTDPYELDTPTIPGGACSVLQLQYPPVQQERLPDPYNLLCDGDYTEAWQNTDGSTQYTRRTIWSSACTPCLNTIGTLDFQFRSQSDSGAYYLYRHHVDVTLEYAVLRACGGGGGSGAPANARPRGTVRKSAGDGIVPGTYPIVPAADDAARTFLVPKSSLVPIEPGIADFLRKQQGCVGCGN